MAGKSKSASTGYFSKEMLDILKKGEKQQSGGKKNASPKQSSGNSAKKKSK